ncbi:hypothetical protein [Agarivorans sp. JK6]|uniref:hypothetical protein n=1 Tax=Agarivorans sp. JK6 TaxID=2997426 RepID=UPI0038732A90
MFKGRKIKLAMAFLVSFSLFGCGGDGSVALDGSNSTADENNTSTIPTSAAFLNLYINPYDAEYSLPLDLYYSYVNTPSSLIGEGVAYANHNGEFVNFDSWEEDISSKSVVFTAYDSNAGTIVGQAGSTFTISSNSRNWIYAYGYIGSNKGLRLAKVPFQDSRPSNVSVNVRLLNVYSYADYEGPLDFYMTKEDGGELVLVASSVAVGEYSSAINVPAHPYSNQFAVVPAGDSLPADPETALFYTDFNDGVGLNGGNNYIMLPVLQPTGKQLLPQLEFVIEKT